MKECQKMWFNLSKTFVWMLLCLAGGSESFAQCKTFALSDRGDTLNCVDYNGKRQGKWLLKIPELRGTPGHEEEGEYIDGKKEGVWRSYTEQGDVYAVETFKWGLKNGKCLYYNLQGLERQESWWAIDPTKPYDTIDVPDLYKDAVYHKMVVKNEGRSMKHGVWKWFDPMTGFQTNSQEFIRDSAVNDLAMFGVAQNQKAPTDSTGKPKKAEKPSIVQEWEKKNSGKKKVNVRDGSAGY